MKNSAACAKAFKTLRKKFPSSSAQWDDGPVEAIVHAHLLWNATARQANTAYRRLMKSVVDLNDLRIQLPSEVKGQVGVNYPQVDERCSRLHATLRSIYLREHDMSLESLSELGKRDIRQYLETLDGVTPFVVGRVLSLCYDTAAMPVDDRTLECLVAAGACHESTNVSELAAWLTRQVKADETVAVHAGLQAWVEAQPKRRPAPKATAAAKKPAAKKKTTRKTTRKTTKKTAKKKSPAKRVARG